MGSLDGYIYSALMPEGALASALQRAHLAFFDCAESECLVVLNQKQWRV
jgi:hypothetical protein